MDGWNTIVSFWGQAYFQGRTAVSFRQCTVDGFLRRFVATFRSICTLPKVWMVGFIEGAESIMAAEMEILAERISQLNPYAARRDTSREPNVYYL